MKLEQLIRFSGLVPESQGQNLALTDVYVPYSLERACTLSSRPSEEEKLASFLGFLSESQGQNMTLTVLYVPNCLNRSSTLSSRPAVPRPIKKETTYTD